MALPEGGDEATKSKEMGKCWHHIYVADITSMFANVEAKEAVTEGGGKAAKSKGKEEVLTSHLCCWRYLYVCQGGGQGDCAGGWRRGGQVWGEEGGAAAQSLQVSIKQETRRQKPP